GAGEGRAQIRRSRQGRGAPRAARWHGDTEKTRKGPQGQRRRAQAPQRRRPEGDRSIDRRYRQHAGHEGKGDHDGLAVIRMSNAEAPLPDPREPFEIPRHVAIIMDGNGRWAAARGLPRGEGHRRGVEALRKTVRAAGEHGISILTIFSFSAENWSRPASE